MVQARSNVKTDTSDEEVQQLITNDDESSKKQKGIVLTSVHIAILVVLFVVWTAVLLLTRSSPSASPTQTISTSTLKTSKRSDKIPECVSSPWKTDEDLVGPCPGELKPHEAAKDIISCADACCAKAECVSWQFRQDTGCLHGPDVRLGLEQDGPPAWCHDAPPARWQGQFLKVVDEDDNSKILKDQRAEACNVKTWKPHEEEGQCFGLGALRPEEASASAQACMEACCNDKEEPPCAAWQWDNHLGCFYGPIMYGCTKTEDPVVFEPFVGRRKNQPSRTYPGEDGKPFKQRLPTLESATP
mmetsp:Transcript_6336/g.10504  ORF Transcript_6336/g.10504 Transcript_6336/m.10504 type:complete len:301 (+) Transcript_6336:88-990(+)